MRIPLPYKTDPQPARGPRRHRRGDFPAHGFTLMELVLLVVVVGLLSVVALPRWLDAMATARPTAVDRLWNATNSALTDAHLAAVMTGQTGPSGSVRMDGRSVALAFGYPTADPGGIGNAVSATIVPTGQVSANGWVGSATTPPTYILGPKANGPCTFTYTEATATTPARIGTPTGC
jgi:MSHA pilin protein MshA